MVRQRSDVLVVGGGLAGWMAAMAAQEQGASVQLIERAARKPGWGNSMVSGGALHAVLRDPRTDPDQLIGMMEELTDGAANPVVLRAWADNARRTIEWIEAHGGDLASDPTQSHRAKVFSPVRVTEPGMKYGGYGLPNFLGHLREVFLAAGGEVIQPARARSLQRDDEAWTVTVRTAGTEVRCAASAVVLADGGFQANPALLRRYVGTDKVRLRGAATATGDGLQMGLSAGGQAVNMAGFYGHLLVRESLQRDDLWPYPILDGLAGVGIVVSPNGERFVDESHSGVTTTNALAWSSAPDTSWLVFDSEAWEHEGAQGVTPPNPYLVEHEATVRSAPTIEDLARTCGIDSETLNKTVAAIETATATPPRGGTVKMRKPPFYGIPVVAGVTFTFGGLLVDGRAAVVDGSGTAIPGLFAAGGTMGGLHGGPRSGYAGGLLEAAVFGLIAGESAGSEGGTKR